MAWSRLTAALGGIKASAVVMTAAAVAGAALCATMVLRTTDALFIGSTENPNNSWTTGTVVLSDNDGGTALFSSGTDGSLVGGQQLIRCIIVKYDGSVTAGVAVKLHAAASGSLASYLNLTVDQGTGGGSTSGSCTNFAVSSPGVYTGTLGDLSANHADFDTGVGTWAPGSTGATMTYRLTITVQNVAGAQGKNATGAFTWEAHSP